MGLALMRFRFPEQAPAVEQVARRFEARTGLRTRTTPESIKVIGLMVLFDEIVMGERTFEAASMLPPHPYGWFHLGGALRDLGGERISLSRDPAPMPERTLVNEWLARPWRELPWWWRARWRLPWMFW
jgi:hypothetical protein